jgi:hypothetical protein
MAAGYTEFIRGEVATRKINMPFTADEICSKAAARFGAPKNEIQYAVNVALNRMIGTEILRYQKGVYYKPKRTIFGLVPISPQETVYREYVETGDGVIGYLTGPALAQKLGLTTQMPRYQYYATNAVKGRERIVENANVVLRQPRTTVTADNYRYLQVLDVIDNKDGTAFEVADPEAVIYDAIERFGLDFGTLVGMAKLYYTQRVLAGLASAATRRVI